MKSNYKKRLRGAWAKDISDSSKTVKRLWEMSTLLALHREFGFGKKRLKRFAKSLNDIYEEFMRRAAITDKYDKKRRELSDIDTAIIQVLRELRRNGIDHRDILGNSEELVMIDEDGTRRNLDDIVDNIEGWEKLG